ncbi:hypothetical protein [Euzebya tangerina]|uniref:hypothetical protein n=1 Tax=Euzebya tangerina TaxID=591198 RepID=UPI0013C320A5|nr:hypothetical protein [Euzebya tangerina]
MPSLLHGPPLVLPRWLDRLAERWARLPPRIRFLALILVILVLLGVQGAQVAGVQTRWGGAGQRVWRATQIVPAGGSPHDHLEAVTLPAAAVPADAVVGRVDRAAVLSLPLVQGGILTTQHLDPIGPAVSLPDDERAVPIPVELGWGIEAGGLVDVWVSPAREGELRRLAGERVVLQVQDDGRAAVALVSIPEEEVATTTTALARGSVLLTLVGRE